MPTDVDLGNFDLDDETTIPSSPPMTAHDLASEDALVRLQERSKPIPRSRDLSQTDAFTVTMEIERFLAMRPTTAAVERAVNMSIGFTDRLLARVRENGPIEAYQGEGDEMEEHGGASRFGCDERYCLPPFLDSSSSQAATAPASPTDSDFDVSPTRSSRRDGKKDSSRVAVPIHPPRHHPRNLPHTSLLRPLALRTRRSFPKTLRIQQRIPVQTEIRRTCKTRRD